MGAWIVSALVDELVRAIRRDRAIGPSVLAAKGKTSTVPIVFVQPQTRRVRDG